MRARLQTPLQMSLADPWTSQANNDWCCVCSGCLLLLAGHAALHFGKLLFATAGGSIENLVVAHKLLGLNNIESQAWPACLHFFDGHLPHLVILFIDVLLCNLLSIRTPSLQLADGSSQHEVLASVVDCA